MTVEVVTKSGPAATVKPTTPAAPVAPAAPTPEALALKSEREKFEHQKRVDEVKLKRLSQKVNSEREAEKKTWGEKLSQVERFEKLKANAKLNPEPYFREILGDAYYEKLTEMRISGGAPAADIVAAKVAELEEKFEGKLKGLDEERKKQEQAQRDEAKKREAGETDQRLRAVMSQFWEANETEYPAIAAEGYTKQQISEALAKEVRRQFNASAEVDAETGEVLKEGVAPNLKALADKWEEGLVSRSKKVASLPKYAVPAGAKSEVQQPRRTLSNDLTGSTPGRQTPATTEAERMQRAIAARDKYLAGKSKS